MQNLPCQHCSSHAYALLKNVNVHTIKDKQILKELLFRFHNVINKKLNKETASLEILLEYECIPLKTSLYNLSVSWKKVTNKMTIHEYASKIKISNTLSNLINWIKTNKRVFIGLE